MDARHFFGLLDQSNQPYQVTACASSGYSAEHQHVVGVCINRMGMVRGRHKKEFEACLCYLCEFMEAINSDDVITILAFRNHQNKLAHELQSILSNLDIDSHRILLDDVDRVISKLSNYRSYMESGSDPEFKGIDWSAAIGHEYQLFRAVVDKVKVL